MVLSDKSLSKGKIKIEGGFTCKYIGLLPKQHFGQQFIIYKNKLI